MSDWYQRQFGDRERFALTFSLGRDPHPVGPIDWDASWGGLAIWAGGRCLTRSVTDSGSVEESVRWNLLPMIEWFLDVGIRLVNEDPFPRFSLGMDVRDGCDWFEATLTPPNLSAEAEERWFLRRSEWRHHHGLRRSSPDVALPNIVFRRRGEALEISWENESWAPPRSDLTFVERRGRIELEASSFAQTLLEALRDVTGALSERHPDIVPLRQLAERARGTAAQPTDWRWLIHRPTAQIIREQMPELKAQLDTVTATGAKGLYVPHTLETQLLRLVRLEEQDDITSLLALSRSLPSAPAKQALSDLVHPSPAQSRHPWEEGNEYAQIVRDALGWEDAPLPDLGQWLEGHGVAVTQADLKLPRTISVVTERTADVRALVHINPRGRSQMKKETGLATALGHVLMDEDPVALDGDWEYWPTSARARAFGVALMLPEEGVRELLGNAKEIGPTEVRQVMAHYRAGPWATTYRLKNIGLISGEQQMELAAELSH